MNSKIFTEEKLDIHCSVPLYLQFQQYIMNQIKAGNLCEGDMLPTEIEISKHLDISRPTVRQALNNLVNQGYLFRVKGKGSFVTRPKEVQGFTQFIESYHVEMENKNLILKTKVLQLEVMKADKFIASKLQLKTGYKVIKLKRLRFAATDYHQGESAEEPKPILLTTVYVPFELIPQLMNYDFEVFSFYEVLNKNNLPVKKVTRELEARCSTIEWSELLQIPYGEAVHFISSSGFLNNGIPIEYAESIYPGSRCKFIINSQL